MATKHLDYTALTALETTGRTPMNACVSVTNRSVVHKHVFVEVRCSTEDAITIELSSHDWAADLDNIVKTIANSFKSLSNMTESDWLLIIHDTIIDKHDPISFGTLLSTQITPPAIFQVIDLNILWKLYAANPPPTDVSLTSIVTPHKKRSPDINDMTNEIIHDMSTQELCSLEQTLSNHDFNLTWDHLIECIKHEMWPILANVIKSMVHNKDKKESPTIDMCDLSDKCVDNVIDMLKKQRRLPSEECRYLRELIARAKRFHPDQMHSKVHHPPPGQLLNVSEYTGLSVAL